MSGDPAGTDAAMSARQSILTVSARHPALVG
ncbi:hypothetical protein BDW27_102494 [Nocardiopsis sp. L17-MgMaSL7]|nr:hypothetical protein BDW27_102494 [Nocardiopsis sp. L17-MgMaSL7]